MFQRVSVAWILGIAVLVAGCRARNETPHSENGPSPVASAGHVTLHVKDMAKLLKLG
jgi:hypothetical protein